MLNIFSSKVIARFSLPLLLAASVTMLTGCGGGGAAASSAAASGVPGTTVATAASVELLVSSLQINSAGTSTTSLTAIVLSATHQVLSGRTVAFSAKIGPATAGSTVYDEAYINNITASGVSDSNGVVTAQLNVGSSKANRIIAVNAVVDGITATNDVSVVGTTVGFSGNTSMSFGATTALTLSVKDSAGNGVSGIPLTLTSQNGNTVTLPFPFPLTDANGSIVANVKATVSGTDVLTATAAGASKTQNLTVSPAVFGFVVPVSSQINVGTPTSISVLWTNNGTSVVSSPVTFTASRGTIASSPATTNASGIATASINSSASGPSIITATGSGGTPSASLTVNFVANTATNITTQASPTTIQPSTGAIAQTTNISTISAVVRDSSLNLVQNARVNFSIIADSSGTLNASTAVTDASGTASVNYQAGATSGSQIGVTISATVVDIGGVSISPVVAPSTVQLTVGGTALFVRLGTDNQVASMQTQNIKTYSALVTDSAGNPASNTRVSFTLRPNRFIKGFYSLTCVGAGCVPGLPWVITKAATCGNEDVSFNGTTGLVSVIAAPNPITGMPSPTVVGGSVVSTNPPLGAANIPNNYNGASSLYPGNVASVNSQGTTDASGFALATISYAKSYSSWVELVLEARALTEQNDPPADVLLVLPGAQSDYNSLVSAIPDEFSPFGVSAGCDNVN